MLDPRRVLDVYQYVFLLLLYPLWSKGEEGAILRESESNLPLVLSLCFLIISVSVISFFALLSPYLQYLAAAKPFTGQ